jgi:transcriptional antiterminator RfaH
MSTSLDTFWFVLHVRSSAEVLAGMRLRECGVETFLPVVSRKIRHACRTYRKVKRPLFPSYLFARFSPALMLRAVNCTPGILRVLGTQHGPQPVEVSVIDSIRERIGEDGCVALFDRGLVRGDPVRVISGPFWGWSGLFERELSDTARVAILLEMLERQCRIVVPREALTLVGAA